jgi:peptidyl-prolyl cis-trans isomerase D
MFRFMRDSEKVKRYLLIFFLGIVSLGMVITLMPLNPSDAARADNTYLAQIGGKKITSQELRKVIDNRLKNSQSGYNPSLAAYIAPSMLDQMVLQEAILLQARKLGIEASPAEVLKAARAIPGLYNNGVFIGEDKLEQATGLTSDQLEAQLGEGIVAQKMQDIITDGVQVTPAEVRAEFLKRNNKAKIQYVLFDPSQYIKAVKVTPEALEAYYKQNTPRYSLPEKRRVRYVLVDSDALRAQVKVSDQEVKQYYNQHSSDYRVPERVHITHILFKTTGKTPAEVATIEKTARDVLNQIKSGKDFGALAKQYSEDSSAQQGGDINWIVRGQTVKEFEDSAFSMKPGQVSELVKTIYGIHILKVLDKQTAHLQTLDEVKEQIRPTLEKEKLDRAQQTLGDELGRRFQKNPKAFDDVARQANLEVKETPLFNYKGILPDFGSSEAFANLSYQLRLNEVGEPISVPKGLAIIQVTAIVAEHQAKLDEARAQVEQDYRASESKVLAADASRQFAEKCKTQDFKAAARAMKLTVKESADFSEQDYVENVGQGSSLPGAFTLPPGKTSDVLPAGANSVVFNVLAHTPAVEANLPQQQDQISEELVQRKRSLAFEIYRKNLKQKLVKSGELKLNDAAMKQFMGTYAKQS